MTIHEYIKIAVSGTAKSDVRYFKNYFLDMNCKWCIYNGYACKHPKEHGVCIEYDVRKELLEFDPLAKNFK